MMLKYQSKINYNISRYDTFSEFPQAVMLLGEEGSGKHLVVDELAKKFNVEINNISEKITTDDVFDMYLSVSPSIYLIDINQLIVSKRIDVLQNTLLKFIEEPPTLSKVIILGSNKNQFLSTIVNRCSVWVFQPYTHDQLIEFANEHEIPLLDDTCLEIFNTPGKLLKFNQSEFNEMFDLCEKIVHRIYDANVSNTLSIKDKIKFNTTDTGFDVSVFCSILLKTFSHECLTCGHDVFLKFRKAYTLTNELIRRLDLIGVNKSDLFQKYLLELRDL